MVVDAPEVIAAGHRRKGAVEREDFQSVSREIEFTDDFRAKQRNHVRTFGEEKTRENFFGDCRSAEHMPAFENDDFLPCFSEIRGVDEAVMAASDDNNVVVLPHSKGLRYKSE